MMNKMLKILLSLGLVSAVNIAAATDLLDVFRQAQQSDPTYQQAKAEYLSAKATLGQARAAFLPNLSLTGSFSRQNSHTVTTDGFPTFSTSEPTANDTKAKSNVTEGTLTLEQNLFDWAAFKTYAKTALAVKQAASQYAAAEQDLILRTADAYFAVLTAQDVLRYTASQKRQLYRNLEVTRQRYHVGLDAITSVYDAQAKYDATKANYIAKENDLAVKKEALRQITGQLYPALKPMRTIMPLVRPVPANIDSWTATAVEQNATLMAARFGAQSALQNVKVQFAGHLPTLAVQGSYDDTSSANKFSAGGTSDTKSSSVGLNLTVPIFSGGNVTYQTRQAEYDYQAAVAQMDAAHRQTIASTRQSYLGVLAEISQIRADRQAIKSARSSLASNEAAYKVGTRTILDVLTAQSTLYDAETTYAQDRFQYVINYLTLKQSAGTLNEKDVVQVNSWLSNRKATTTYKRKKPKAKRPAKKAKKTTKPTVAKKTRQTKTNKVVRQSASKSP